MHSVRRPARMVPRSAEVTGWGCLELSRSVPTCGQERSGRPGQRHTCLEDAAEPGVAYTLALLAEPSVSLPAALPGSAACIYSTRRRLLACSRGVHTKSSTRRNDLPGRSS